VAQHSAAHLLSAWNPAARDPAHRRLAALLAAIDVHDGHHDDTLGQRNQRLLHLHRALVGTPLEARVRCEHCGVDSEFTVPTDAIIAAPPPPSDARIRIRSRGRTLSFRLPRMADIEAAGRQRSVSDVRRVVLERCRIDGSLDLMTDAAAERLGRELEALDQAANIVVNIACSGCRAGLAVSVDLATFVARDLDRIVGSLYREIDTIASAYGWNEASILALPPERRRRYVSLITARADVRAVAPLRAP
jgi:hypothetical protein